MEKHGFARLALATLVAMAIGGCARPAPRGAVALSGDGQSSWVFVETRDADRNGIWWCTAPPTDQSAPPRCVKAVLQTSGAR